MPSIFSLRQITLTQEGNIFVAMKIEKDDAENKRTNNHSTKPPKEPDAQKTK